MPPEVIIYVLGLCLAIPGCGPSTAADRAESWKRGGRSVALAEQICADGWLENMPVEEVEAVLGSPESWAWTACFSLGEESYCAENNSGYSESLDGVAYLIVKYRREAVVGLSFCDGLCDMPSEAFRSDEWSADQLKRGPMALWLAENAALVGKSRSQVIAQLGPPAREWRRAAYVIERVSGFPFGSRRRLFEIEFDVESGRVIESRVALQ